MPERVTAYKVFIASPRGLQAEREAFRKALAEQNEADALHRGCMFLPIGWELTLGGVGRPQELINEDVRRCDYFVLMLWDRWGSPTDKEPGAKYSSGTEEEFHVAMECFNDDSHPMRQIVVLFKAVDDRQLGDIGPELRRVVDFKKQLEADKTLLFTTFDDTSRFEHLLRMHLAQWLREHEEGPTSKVIQPEVPASPLAPPSDAALGQFPVPSPGADDVIIKAIQLENQGRITEAEATYANALAGEESARVLHRYGRLLLGMGRLTDAENVLRRGLEQPFDTDVQRADLLNDLVYVLDTQGRYSEAAAYSNESLRLDPTDPTLIYNHAMLLRRRGKYREARLPMDTALSLMTELHGADSPETANVETALGGLFFEEGRFDDARRLLSQALEKEEKDASTPAWFLFNVLWRFGSLCLKLGELDRAASLFERALGISEEDAGSPHLYRWGIPAISGLAEVSVQRGSLHQAEQAYRRALKICEKAIGVDHPVAANSLDGLGRVQALQGRFQEAERSLRRALAVRQRFLGSEHPNTARSILGIGELYRLQGHSADALKLYQRAIATLDVVLPADHPDTARAREELAALEAETKGEKRRRSSTASRTKAAGKKTPRRKKPAK